MATMNVSLPDPMKAWVEAQTETGKYSNSSDYVRDLIRRDQARSEHLTHLRRIVQDGIDSGVSDRTLEDIRLEVEQRLRADGKI